VAAVQEGLPVLGRRPHAFLAVLGRQTGEEEEEEEEEKKEGEKGEKGGEIRPSRRKH